MKGTIITWHQERGFGFVRPDTGYSDVFLHASALKKAGVILPSEGDTLEFDVAQDDRGRPQVGAIHHHQRRSVR